MPTEQVSLESEEQEKLFVLLLEYTDMFALCNELGRTNVLQHEIHTGDASKKSHWTLLKISQVIYLCITC